MTATLVNSPGILSAPGLPDMVYDRMVQIACGCSASIGHRTASGQYGFGFVACSPPHNPALERGRMDARCAIERESQSAAEEILLPIMQRVEDELARQGFISQEN